MNLKKANLVTQMVGPKVLEIEVQRLENGLTFMLMLLILLPRKRKS